MKLSDQLRSIRKSAKPAFTFANVDGEQIKIFIATLTPDEIDLMETQWGNYKSEDDAVGVRAFTFAYCLCNENNVRDLDPGDDTTISKEFAEAVQDFGNNAQLSRTISHAFEIISKKVGWNKKDIEALEKNSEATTEKGGNGGKRSRPAKRGANGSKASETKKS